LSKVPGSMLDMDALSYVPWQT